MALLVTVLSGLAAIAPATHTAAVPVLRRTPVFAVWGYFLFRRWTMWNFGSSAARHIIKALMFVWCNLAPKAGKKTEAVGVAAGSIPEHVCGLIGGSIFTNLIVASIATAGLLGDQQLTMVGKAAPILVIAAGFIGIAVFHIGSGKSVDPAFECARLSVFF